jgi:glycosyltransferase involved in cell wall biosynthesis
MTLSSDPGNGISVIICAYTEKRWEKLVAAIQSIRSQTLPIAELVLVIDHNPGLYQRSCEAFPGVLVVENRETRGLSGARNTGIRAAHGDLLAFLDDDAVAAPDWLALLCEHFSDDTVLGVGGLSEPDWEAERPAWFPEEFLWVVGCSYRGLPQQIAAVRNPLGGCTCWRREVFITVGNFDSTLGHVGSLPAGCEETELSIRATQRWPGRKFLYDPRSRIFHFVPQARARFSYFRSRCYAEGISKAGVTRLVGPADGLSAERSYTFKTLPAGFLRGLADFFSGDFGGLGRAGAIFLGLAFTALGYLVGRVQQRLAGNVLQEKPGLSL